MRCPIYFVAQPIRHGRRTASVSTRPYVTPGPAGESDPGTSVVLASDVGPLEGELAISMVTLAELPYGVLAAKESSTRSERLRRLSILQREFDAVPIDDAVSDSYGLVAAAVVEVGRQPRARTMDLLIAATAHAFAVRLYTRNAGDFTGIDELVDVAAV